MATLRREQWIARPASAVWEIVGDPAAVTSWFPGMAAVEVDGSTRLITLDSGLPLQEEIVEVRNDLRRFQYRLLGPLPIEHHLATIDVIDNGDRCLVLYSTDVAPPALAPMLDGAVGDALQSLRDLVEAI